MDNISRKTLVEPVIIVIKITVIWITVIQSGFFPDSSKPIIWAIARIIHNLKSIRHLLQGPDDALDGWMSPHSAQITTV